MRRFAAVLAASLALFACSHPTPPAGRWEGAYDSGGTMIAARLEIEANGTIRVSAPDLSSADNLSDEDRAAMHQRLSEGLSAAWSDVVPRPMDFDGKVFRKPGGIAPQMIWNSDAKQMTLVVYLGTRPSIRFALRAVADFSDNPWAS